MLTSAAEYQPAFLVDLFAAKGSTDVQDSNVDSLKQPANEAGSQGSKNSSLVDALLHYVVRANDLINGNLWTLLNILNLIKALWQGPAQFTQILSWLGSSEIFWKK